MLTTFYRLQTWALMMRRLMLKAGKRNFLTLATIRAALSLDVTRRPHSAKCVYILSHSSLLCTNESHSNRLDTAETTNVQHLFRWKPKASVRFRTYKLQRITLPIKEYSTLCNYASHGVNEKHSIFRQWSILWRDREAYRQSVRLSGW